MSFQSGSGTTSGTFTGVPLYDFLTSSQGGGGLVLNNGVKNDILRDYVVATGSDGYKAVISLGEISPRFGNNNVLVAYSANGQGLGADAMFRIS